MMWFPVVIISSARETFERLRLRLTLESICLACLFCVHSSILYFSSIVQCFAKIMKQRKNFMLTCKV